MEIQYESKGDIVVELEKICCEWNIYAKRIERPRLPPLALDVRSTLISQCLLDY